MPCATPCQRRPGGFLQRKHPVIIAYREAFEPLRANPCPRQTVVPPNRLEASYWDLLASLVRRPGHDPRAALQSALSRILDREHVILAPSARCAIAQVLSLLPQREVVMPAFNCGVVKGAVEAAGKHIIYVDVAKHSVNAGVAEFAAAAKPGRVLLITHQFGVPTDVEAICELARSRGCVTIEDAACSFGSRRNGQQLGTFADFGIYSFESWKRLPAFRGGAIVVNNPSLLDPIRLSREPLVATKLKLPTRELAAAMARNVATIPWIYGRAVLPKLLDNYRRPAPESTSSGVPASVTHGPPYTREFHPYQAQLVLRMLKRMDRIRGHIGQLASLYQEALKGSPVVSLFPSSEDEGGVLRFPIAFAGKSRAEALREALGRGLYLETEFEQPLPAPAELINFPNAVWAGKHVVLLPLYTALSLEDARVLAGHVTEIARDVPDRKKTAAHP